MNDDISTEKTSLCSGYCTLTLDLHRMIRSCNQTLSSDTLGLNISLGFAYLDNPTFTTQVFSLVLICNKPKCNSNTSISELLTIVNAFFTAQSIGIRISSLCWFYQIIFFSILSNKTDLDYFCCYGDETVSSFISNT